MAPHDASFVLVRDALEARGGKAAVQCAAVIFPDENRQIDARILCEVHIPRGIEIIAVDGEDVEVFPPLHHERIVRLRPAKTEVQVIGVHRTACFRGDADVFPDEEGGIRPNVLCGTGITGGAGIDRLLQRRKISKCRAPNLVERFHRAIFFAQELNQPFAAAGGSRVVQHLIGNGQILHKIEFRFIAQEIPDEPRIVLPRFELLRV